MKRLIFCTFCTFTFSHAAIAEPGDGPGGADIWLDGKAVAVTGVCQDWAFQTVGGMPSLSVTVGAAQTGDTLMFYDNASFIDGEDAWFIEKLDDLKQTDHGYVLVGQFTNVQAKDKPTLPFQIEVVCP